jgi:phasin family protein
MTASAHIPHDFTNTLTKACEEMNNLTANFIGAATKSNAAAWQGLEDLARNMGGIMQESLTRSVHAYTAMTGVKSPQEAAETHADFLKDSFDSAMATSGKLSEISLRTAQSAIQPLTQHANEAMGAIMKKAKAG